MAGVARGMGWGDGDGDGELRTVGMAIVAGVRGAGHASITVGQGRGDVFLHGQPSRSGGRGHGSGSAPIPVDRSSGGGGQATGITVGQVTSFSMSVGCRIFQILACGSSGAWRVRCHGWMSPLEAQLGTSTLSTSTQVEEASNVYSLGVMMLEVLTGDKAFSKGRWR